MGRGRHKTAKLAEKLLQIRLAFGLSQTGMFKHLDVEDLIVYNRISDYELGKREPPLVILLRYARAAGVHMEALADDDLNLPDKLPGTTEHEAIKRQYASPRKGKR